MNDDRKALDDAAEARGGDASMSMDNGVGATIRLWRAPNRIWPAFPTLVVVRAASRLSRGRAQRQRPAVGEGGVVSVYLDGSKVGDIAPNQIKLYQVSAGDHSFSLRFLGGLRRSKELHVPLAAGEEKQFACLLNTFGWPTIRPATANDLSAMERPNSAPDGGSEPA